MNNIIYKPFHTKESYDNNQAKVFTEWFSGSLLMDQTLVYLVDKHPDFNVETTCFNRGGIAPFWQGWQEGIHLFFLLI